jgi:cytochrome c oxidase assembly protein Cox11
MHPIFRFSIYFILFLLFGNFCLTNYNSFCLDRQRDQIQCEPIFPSFYLQQILTPIFSDTFDTTVEIEFKSYSQEKDLQFFPGREKFVAKTNAIYLQDFYLINNSEKKITFRPNFFISPQKYKNDVITYRCLCNNKYTLKPQETRIIKMAYQITNNKNSNPEKKYQLQYNTFSTN